MDSQQCQCSCLACQTQRHDQCSLHIARAEQHGIFFHPHSHQSTFQNQQLQPEMIFNGFSGYPEYEYGIPAVYLDEYDEGNEVTTRPRLTKDQVDVLENEFQKNSKPNSVLKRQLALHTNLTLNRVANWFQNRRAKAKQQKKQEEYESSQQQEQQTSQDTDIQLVDDDDDDNDTAEEQDDSVSPYTTSSTDTAKPSTDTASSCSVLNYTGIREKGLASLQRALDAADAARHGQNDSICGISQKVEIACEMPPPAFRQAQMPSSRSPSQAEGHTRPEPQAQQLDWNHKVTHQPIWPVPPVATGAMSFDFGFDACGPQEQAEGALLASPTDSGSRSQSIVLSPDAWEASLYTPTMPHQTHFQQSLHSPGLSTPAYSSSRRGSIADALTNNFAGFGIANGTAQMSFPMSGTTSSNASDCAIDLASRRRRPRPAALNFNSESLRTRSYGALPTASPTFRQGGPPAAAQVLRHVKSTGHSLNNHYAGIRKSSLPQKSPLNISTFAESEFQQLMARKAAKNTMKQQITPVSTSSQRTLASSQMPTMPLLQHAGHVDLHTSQNTHLQSPPITPYQQDFFLQTSSMLPPSIQAQYAHFSDYTPPYSAGPMTNSSWSDAPLTSPDMASFPPVSYIPSLMEDMRVEDHSQAPWILQADQSPNMPIHHLSDHKQTQFRIETFPNQKEEHAQAAQHLNGSRPKHYAFQHHKPEDFIQNS